MEPSNELTIDTQDAREWELSDEELDRTTEGVLAAFCSNSPVCGCSKGS